MVTETPLVEAVSLAIREVGAAEVMSRFNQLATGDVSEKSPGDLVTVADQECERVLGERLRELRDVPVVGEEATAADPALPGLVDHAEAVWIVDPIDGTANFVDGKPDFGVMVALVEHGRTTHGWVWHPTTDAMLTVAPGSGTHRNGTPAGTLSDRSLPVGVIKRKFMPEPAKTTLADWPAELATIVWGKRSAAIEYADLIDGEIDFIFYWRTWPWDHAPCALLAEHAGYRVGRLDGQVYRPGDGGAGLLSARPDLWESVAAEIRAAFN